jgi:hypothetical protein
MFDREGSPRTVPDFAQVLKKNYECTDVLFRLAGKSGVVLMHGGGFGGPEWSVEEWKASRKSSK